jgi:Recombinase
VPIGYAVEKHVVEGTVITKRVIDPSGAALVERIWTMFGAGEKPGDISRKLNAEGIRTSPRKDKPNGGMWTTRAVRHVLKNVA